jgi:hypothetical protein
MAQKRQLFGKVFDLLGLPAMFVKAMMAARGGYSSTQP